MPGSFFFARGSCLSLGPAQAKLGPLFLKRDMAPSARKPLALLLMMALASALRASSDLVPSQASALSAQSAGAGSALLALPGSCDALDSMPSSLAGLDQAQLAGFGASWPQGSALQGAVGALPLTQGWVLGLGYQDEHVSDFSLADPQGGWVGGLSGDLDQVSLGLAKGLDRFSLGATLLADQAAVASHPPTRLGLLLGLGWQPAAGVNAAVSAGMQGPESQALARLGAAYGFDEGGWGRATIGMAGELWQQDSGGWGLGLQQGFWGHLFLRAGCQHQPGQGMAQAAAATCGVGLAAWGASLDYALVRLAGQSQGPGSCFSLIYSFAPEPQASLTALARPALPKPPGLPALTPTPTSAPTVPLAPAQSPSSGLLELPGAQTQMDLAADPLAQGDALAAQGRDKEAVQAYLAALRQEPADLLAWKALARAYARLQRPDWARRCWQKALQVAPKDAEALAALAAAGP